MEGIEQLLFDLLRSMFKEGGLGQFLLTLETSMDPREIMSHVKVATAAALRTVTRKQARRPVPPSRRPVLFDLIGIEVQGNTLAFSFNLRTRVSNMEFSLWL